MPLPRLTVRRRLTVAFGAIAFGSGALIIAALYLFMRFVPTYITAGGTPPPEGGTGDFGRAKPAVPGGNLSDALQITEVSAILDTLLWAGIAILLVISALASWVGWVVSGRMVRPLARIAEAAKRAGDGRLDHRIALTGPQDEIQDLADTFDRTLDRLERAFSAHERFAANAAHELRTPLTATKTILDIARAHPGSVDAATVFEQIGRNNDRSIGTVQALLDLTSAEAARIETESVDLSELLETVVARAVPEAISPVLRLRPTTVQADPLLLETLVENLVQNAVRHNDERGLLEISTNGSVHAWLRIENTGPEIAEDELARLTEPMYRARRSNAPGNGLGLAIARSIAEAHSAELTLAARPGGGLIAELTLPLP
ncbi:HAMP domain-containing sensor histidine kinase [Leucobacter iarius]|uniref:sensor histidine kinase n=1 Tax=Leucobacter iarius TaxID=333963 RepID=UPI0031D9CD48